MTEPASRTTDDRPVEEPAATKPPATPTEAQPAVKGLDRRRGFGSVLRSPWVPWVIAVLALAFGVFALLQRNEAREQWAQLREAEQTRAEVGREANTVALRLTTFEGEDIEDWYADIRETATGQFKDQLGQVFNQETRDTLREIGVVSVGEMQDLFVQDVDGDDARAFALVKQTYVNSSTPDPVEDHQRMDIHLKRVDGQWLASEVSVLGPNGVIAPSDAEQAVPNSGGGDQ